MGKFIGNIAGIGAFIIFTLAILSLSGWITHIIWGLTNLNADNALIIVGFMILGIIAAPIGILHGWSLWLGASWLTPIYTKTVALFLQVMSGIGV